MTRSRNPIRSLCTLLAVVLSMMLGACAYEMDDVAAYGEGGATLSWEEFRAGVFQTEGGNGVFIVDGDIPILTEEALREHWERSVARYEGAALSSFQDGSGRLAWGASQKRNLTFCVDRAGFRYDAAGDGDYDDQQRWLHAKLEEVILSAGTLAPQLMLKTPDFEKLYGSKLEACTNPIWPSPEGAVDGCRGSRPRAGPRRRPGGREPRLAGEDDLVVGVPVPEQEAQEPAEQSSGPADVAISFKAVPLNHVGYPAPRVLPPRSAS